MRLHLHMVSTLAVQPIPIRSSHLVFAVLADTVARGGCFRPLPRRRPSAPDPRSRLSGKGSREGCRESGVGSLSCVPTAHAPLLCYRMALRRLTWLRGEVRLPRLRCSEQTHASQRREEKCPRPNPLHRGCSSCSGPSGTDSRCKWVTSSSERRGTHWIGYSATEL